MRELYDQTESLQNLLVSRATGGIEDDAEYLRLRQVVLNQPALEPLVPRFIRTCRNLAQFWQYIKYEYGSYAERRQYLWDQFHPMLEVLERGGMAPSDQVVSTMLEAFDSAHVQAAWSKALDRRASDPEGAITMARTLLESVCKHILDESGVAYDDCPRYSNKFLGAVRPWSKGSGLFETGSVILTGKERLVSSLALVMPSLPSISLGH